MCFFKLGLKKDQDVGFTLCKKCPYLELFWTVISRIRTRITPNTDTFRAVEATTCFYKANEI